MERIFKVILHENRSGSFTVTVPSLPGCITQGSNRNEALEHVKEAIAGHIEALILVGEKVPQKDVEFTEVRVSV